MDTKKSNILKSFFIIIMMAFMVKCIYLNIDLNNIYIGAVYLKPGYWLPKYKPSKNKYHEYKPSSQKLLANKHAHSNQFQEKSSCRSMFEIHKSAEQNWDKDEPYEALSDSLPPLLLWPQEGKTDGGTGDSTRKHGQENQKNKQNISNISDDGASMNDATIKPILLDETRLQILNGSVPYLPCKTKHYTADDVETCVSARAAVGSSTWIAFVGASKMREKLHEFINLLPRSFTYECFVAEEKVNYKKFVDSLVHKVHGDYDIIGYSDNAFDKGETHKIRITVLWEPYGIGIESDFKPPESLFGTGIESDFKPPEHPSTRFSNWATDKIVPDVIVIGFGTWYLLQPALLKSRGQLYPFDSLDFRIRKLKNTINQIAKKTKVLLWAHSRFRQYEFRSEPRPPGDVRENQVNDWFKSRLLLHTLSYSIGYMDSWISNIILKDAASVWRWDSTLPFQYANIRECASWRPSAKMNYPNGSVQADTRYTGKWWHCQDTHHSSYQTNHDEAIMLLNMLCNPFSDNTREDLCC